jgi:hypothetical protein
MRRSMRTLENLRVVAAVLAFAGSFEACKSFGDFEPGSGAGGKGGNSGAPSGFGGAGTSGGSKQGGSAGASAEGGGAAGETTGGAAGDTTGGEAGAPSGGASGDAGASGDGGSGGGTGGTGPECWLDQTVTGDCFMFPPGTQPPGILFFRARGAAVAAVNNYDGRFQVFATQPKPSNTIGTAYTTSTGLNGFHGWFCFDAVPYPERLVATTLSNGRQEVFVTTECGRVYVRRSYLQMVSTAEFEVWSSWVPLALPSAASFVSDLSVARSVDRAQNRLFAVDRGAVFTSSKNEAYGPYGSWREVARGAGDIVASGVSGSLGAPRYRLFTIRDGRPFTAVPKSSDVDAPFEHWTDFDPESSLEAGLVDIDAPYDIGERLLVAALDNRSNVWIREEDASGGFGSWRRLDELRPPAVPLVSLAGAVLVRPNDRPVMLVVTGTNGTMYSALRGADSTWGPWIPYA